MIKKILFFSLLLLIIQPTTSFSQNKTNDQRLEVQGLAINPFLIETEIEPGQSDKRSITLFNTTEQPLPISVSINDFTPYGPSGQPRFLESNETTDQRFSLSSWITITKQPELTIPAKGTTSIDFTINPPEGSEPGTHYGGILFSWRSNPVNNAVTVNQKVGTIILAKLGKAEQNGSISSFQKQNNNQTQSFVLGFNNTGNVHLKPKGEIFISNMFGRQVADLFINPNAEVVLPHNTRTFQVNWPNAPKFGWYTATVVLYYGSPKIETRASVRMLITPSTTSMVLIVITSLVGIALIIFGIKRYNAWLRRKYGV